MAQSVPPSRPRRADRPLRARRDLPPPGLGALAPLTPGERRQRQAETLVAPPRKYHLDARILFWMEDRLWGKGRSLPKFRARELVARTPYQAWEQASYFAVTATGGNPDLARSIYDHVVAYRAEQDNEQWHLLVLEELIDEDGGDGSRLRFRLLPQIVAFGFYQVSFALFTWRRPWSYRLNADIEDHAEHEYAELVAEHPEWESVEYHSTFAGEYVAFESRADVLRQIGYDERLHKEESIARIMAA